MINKMAKGERSAGILGVFKNVKNLFLTTTNNTMNHPTFRKIMKNEEFDLVIHGFVFNLFHLGLGLHFKCPSVVLSTSPAVYSVNKLIGQPMNPEAVPSFTLNIKGQMSFFQRLKNMIMSVMEMAIDFILDYMNGVYYRQNFAEEKYPSFQEAKKNVALVLVNSHFSQANVRPYLPNLIEVGGMHIKEKQETLPKDIKDWIDTSENGVILVSLGANLKSADLPKEKQKLLLNVFGSLKQRVLWKFEDESIKNLPKNVMIKKWLPQDSILAHPHTKAFITHMGIGSYHEAIYFGVPVVAIPFGGDQPTNAQRAKLEGWTEIVPFSQLTKESLENALNLIISEPKYKETIQKLSEIYKDRPMTPIDTALYWIEYVIRYKGAPQLKYAGAELNFIQRNSLDVFGFFAIIVYIGYTFLCWILRKIKMFCSKSKSKDQIKEKNY